MATSSTVHTGLTDDTRFPDLLPGLTRELERSLIGLVLRFEEESFPTWRFLNRDFLEAESFWKDLQNGFYDSRFDVWRVPELKSLVASTGETGMRFNFHTNLYKAWGWVLISVLGQKTPTVRFLPEDPTDEADIIAARAASDVMPLIERNNRVGLLNVRAAYLLYTHGICGFYTRYIEDGEKFGWKETPDIEVRKVMLEEAFYHCPGCIRNFTIEQVRASGLCPNCSRPFEETDFHPPVYGDVPVVSGTIRVPRGQEVITVHGGLELRLPPWTGPNLRDMPYLGLVFEVHKSELMATYGDRARGLSGGWGSGPYDTWDRFARLALIEPTVSYYSTSNQNLITFKQYWLRPSTFFLLPADKRDRLLELFPDGAYIAFADSSRLLMARNERVDDHWTILTGMEGPGTYTPALGQSALSIQKRYNTLHNFIMEWVEYAASGMTFINAGLLSADALTRHRRAPGNIYPVPVPPNIPLSNAIYESQPQQLPGQVLTYAQELEKIGEFITSALPSVSGGAQASLKPGTFLADREAALGRLYLPWLHMRYAWADVAQQAVQEFARWRTEDERYTLFGPRGELIGKTIRINDLKGKFRAHPEVNENFPVLWQQLQQLIIQLLESPLAQPLFSQLANIEFLRTIFQLPDIYVPGEDDRIKQQNEIAELLQQEPIPQADGQPGPSVPVDEFADNHPVHIETIKQWAVSLQGMEAARHNPAGYQNVILHGLAHQRVLNQQAQAQMGQELQGAPPGRQPSIHGGHNPPPPRPVEENSLGQARQKLDQLARMIAAGQGPGGG